MADPQRFPSSSGVTWEGDVLVLSPAHAPWPVWPGYALAGLLGLLSTNAPDLIGVGLFIAVFLAVATFVVQHRQARRSAGVRALPKGLVCDGGYFPWASCSGLVLFVPHDGSGRLVLGQPLVELVRREPGQTDADTMRSVANALARVSGLTLEERDTSFATLHSGRTFEPRKEGDFDQVRFFVAGGRGKPFGTTSTCEAHPVVASRDGLQVGSRFERWEDIRSIDLEVRPDTVVADNRPGQVLAGFVTVDLDLDTWVILRRTVGLTPTSPPSNRRRLGDHAELEGLVVALRKLREQALGSRQGGTQDVPEALAELLSKQRKAEESRLR